MSEFYTVVTRDDLVSLLQSKGFQAERVSIGEGREGLRSAANGFTFHIAPGNGESGSFRDFTYFANFRLDGVSLNVLCEKWNSARRFGRLHAREGLLNFEMDVLLAGGVSHDYLVFTLELWNHLLLELMNFLREETQALTKAA